MKEGKTQFDATANQPRMLFKPGSWLAKIDFINHLILFNNVLIAVLSEKEGGKTSFNALLQNNLDLQIKSIAMTVKPPCDREAIINDIATQLHLNNDAQTNMTSIVAQVNERKAHVLLVIDDAQHLPETLIKEAMLAIKNQDDFGFFHLCLISDYSVVATLNSLAADHFNNLVHTIELGSLNESETRTYVLQRAMGAHLINKPLTDTQFKQFYQLTKGNLAKINSSLEAFVFNCSSQKKNNKTLVLKRTSLAIVATLTVGISYLYFDGNPYVTDVFRASTFVQKEEISQDITHPEQFPSHIASWQDSSIRQLVHYALPKKQVLDGMEFDEDNLKGLALVDKVVVIPTIKPKSIHDEPVSLVGRKVAESKLVAFREHSMVVKKPDTHLKTNGYTIQLVASHVISDVHLFRKNNNLMDKTQIRHFTNAKGSWYILTFGEYDSRNKAQLNARKLPAKLTKLNPWIRPMSGLSSVG